MNNDICEQDSQSRLDRLFRPAVLIMIVVAVLGYVVAFVQSERGTVHYDAYVEAYTHCYQRSVDTESAAMDCNHVPEVREHLLAHRSAIAVGEPFFNLALVLTAAVILLPLARRFRRRQLARAQARPDNEASTARHPA